MEIDIWRFARNVTSNILEILLPDKLKKLMIMRHLGTVRNVRALFMIPF